MSDNGIFRDLTEADIDRMIEDQRMAAEEEQAQIWLEIEAERWASEAEPDDQGRIRGITDRKPRVWSGREFVTTELEEPPYIIENFFPYGGLGMLHGKRGLGKSMLTMAMAHSVSTGQPFLGQFPVRQGPVVVLQLDMVETVFQERLLTNPDFYGSFDWYPVTGVAKITRANENTPWVKEVNDIQPNLIIIDTLRKAHNLDENSSNSPDDFYNKLRELFGYTAVLMIHHDRKSSREAVSQMNDESFRGSGAWMDDIDVGLHLMNDTTTGLRVEFSKVRTCPDIESIPVKINTNTLILESLKVQTYDRADVTTEKNPRRSKIDIARAQARAYMKDHPAAPRDQVHKHLISVGHPQPRTSLALDSIF